jgi:putative hydrolase of the HAD superfamily
VQLLLSDADNTLWDTNAVYAAAQLRLLEEVEEYVGNSFQPLDRLAFVRSIDQSIAAKHPNGLRYPPILLTTELIRTAIGEPRDEFGALSCEDRHYEAARQFERDFVERVRGNIPELREGVSQGLCDLNAMGTRIVVFTEGDEARCRSLLQHHHIAQFVSDLKSTRKSVEEYLKMAKDFYDSIFMVGDQLDVDIALAKTAGFTTIYFPSSFAPEWIERLENVADFTIESYRQIPGLLMSK